VDEAEVWQALLTEVSSMRDHMDRVLRLVRQLVIRQAAPPPPAGISPELVGQLDALTDAQRDSVLAWLAGAPRPEGA
jgi:hypothetical protein